MYSLACQEFFAMLTKPSCFKLVHKHQRQSALCPGHNLTHTNMSCILITTGFWYDISILTQNAVHMSAADRSSHQQQAARLKHHLQVMHNTSQPVWPIVFCWHHVTSHHTYPSCSWCPGASLECNMCLLVLLPCCAQEYSSCWQHQLHQIIYTCQKTCSCQDGSQYLCR